ncbi:DUF5134 domain-containing protein [Streptomyces sp. 8N706]|uniref:DUF5134 domain-containing protein n=1 Tax=Streptomyces sp. 8N706 TaxID=3457416 RepID=UPI003FCF73C0
MHGPPLVGWLVVGLCGASGVYCLLLLRSAGPPGARRDAGGEALMGLGMAAMAVPVLDPQPWAVRVFAAVFAVLAVRGLVHARTGGHHLHHAVGSLAMVYTALSMPGGGAWGPEGHAGHVATQPSGGFPMLTGLLLVYFAVYVLRTGTRIVPLGGADPAGSPTPVVAGWVDRPELATACRMSMAMAMFTMLLAV